MKKREKKVYADIHELAHVWAQQTKEYGRLGRVNSKGSFFGQGYTGVRAYFEGTAIYSYGSHYKMAEFHGDAVLVNSTKYSNTTTNHQHSVVNAITHKTLFRVPNVSNPKALENIEYLASQAANAYTVIVRSLRGVYDGLPRLRAAIKTHNEYLKTFGIRGIKPIELSDEDEETLYQLIKIQNARSAVYEAKRTAKQIKAREERLQREAKQRNEALEDLEAWKRGVDIKPNTYFLPHMEYDVLRVKGDVVETHRGASVPLKTVMGLLSRIDSKSKVSGLKIGDFMVTSKSGDVIKIGCHTFKISEARKVIENTGLQLIQGGKNA